MGTSKTRHSRAGGNPVLLFNRLWGFVIAAQWSYFSDWIPACAGMTNSEFVKAS